MILTDIVQKTEVYGALRRVRAPQEVEKAIAADVEADARRQSSMSQSPPAMQSAQLPEVQFAAPQNDGAWTTTNGQPHFQAGPMPMFDAPSINLEPHESPATVSSENTAEVVVGRENRSPSEAMVDVDWNEWDRLFPPDAHFSEFGSLPDFNFSTMVPDNTLQYPAPQI